MNLPFHIICLDQCKLKLTHDSMKDGFRYLDPKRIIILELPLALKRIQKVKESIEDEVVDDDSQISSGCTYNRKEGVYVHFNVKQCYQTCHF